MSSFRPPSAQVLIQTGFQMLERGRVEEAWNAFHEALNLDSNQSLAHHMIGLMAMQAGRLEMGVESISRSISLNPVDPVAYGNLANGLRDLGRTEEALGAYSQALSMDPRFQDALNNRAILLSRLGRHEEALEDYDRALAINSRVAPLHNNRAEALRSLGRRTQAIEGYREAIRIDPNLVEAWFGLANVLIEERKLEKALTAIDRAIELRPNMVDAHVNRGNVLIDLGRANDALDGYDRALSLLNINPGAAPTPAGTSLPLHAGRILSNRANALRMLDRYAEALDTCNVAVNADPDCADARVNWAIILGELGRHEEAIAVYDTCLRRWPDLPAARFGHGIACLAMGDFVRGWHGYEARFHIRGPGAFVAERPVVRPSWRGEEPLSGKTILLYSEQGLGDTLQFCRYADLVKASGARVVIEAQRPLVRLLRSLEGADLVVEEGGALPDFDVQASIMSLPLAFGSTVDGPPAEVPYLHPERDLVEAWSHRLGKRTRPRVGLVWAAGFRPDLPAVWSVRHRDIPLEMLAPLAEADVEFISLQKGERARKQLAVLESQGWQGPSIRDLTVELGDFADTAALVANLDLVISVCTSTAHLTGALGKPIWILNRFDSCWRWMRDRTDSPWYPTARLFRQATIGDWPPVVQEVKAALRRFALTGPDGEPDR